jgi:hypothetical protein
MGTIPIWMAASESVRKLPDPGKKITDSESASHLEDAPEGEEEHECAVARVPEHDGEEEGEGDDGVDGGVRLPVGSVPDPCHFGVDPDPWIHTSD